MRTIYRPLLLFVSALLLFPTVTSAASTKSISLTAASSQFLSITDAAQTGLDVSPNLTLEAWVNMSSVPTNNGAWFVIISKYTNSGSNDRQYMLDYRQEGGVKKLVLTTSANGTANETHSATMDLGTSAWHHVAVTFTGASHAASFYKDGVFVSTDTGGAITSLYNGAKAFAIGTVNPFNSPSDFMNGLVDDARVWSVVRTTDEIGYNYSCSYKEDITGLVSNWLFEDNLLDETTSNNDLTNNNSATFSTTVPTLTNCTSTGGEPTPTTTPSTSTFTYTTSPLLDYFVVNFGRALLWIMGGLLTFAFFAMIIKVGRRIDKPRF